MITATAKAQAHILIVQATDSNTATVVTLSKPPTSLDLHSSLHGVSVALSSKELLTYTWLFSTHRGQQYCDDHKPWAYDGWLYNGGRESELRLYVC